MSIPSNIKKSHLVKAINKIDDEGIPKGADSQYYDVLYNNKKYPPKLIVSYANIFANGSELNRDSFSGGLDTPCFRLLSQNGFEIISKNNRSIMQKVKLYDTHGSSATKNYSTLITTDKKYFYWDNKQFTNYNIGDVVFWTNRELKEALFTIIDQTSIKPSFVDNMNVINDGEYRVLANAQHNQFELFYRFKIIQITSIPIDWEYSDKSTFANQLMAYKLFEAKIDKIPGRVSKLNDLIKLFPSGEAFVILNNAKNMLEGEEHEIPVAEEKSIAKNRMSTKEIISHSHRYITNKGFKYHYEEIANFFLSIKTKPFVILAGISGTGKTQLARKFANSLGFSKNHIIQIPVRPDWTDGSDLLGYTSLDGRFVAKDLTLAIQSAISNPKEPYFFILDEMNLARVEHYFSDFLSIIETREWANGLGSDIKTDPILRDEALRNATEPNEFKELCWPKNLYLIGTVNMDETTHAFSRKVLDRANSIEMNDISLDWTNDTSTSIPNLTGISNALLETEFLTSSDLSDLDKESINNEIEKLKSINSILQLADLQFAYRVRDEIAFYLVLNKKYELLNDDTALDFQLVQKVLPRIHGSSERIQKVLINLLNLLEGTNFRIDSVDYSELEKSVDTNNLKFKRSSKKILFMLKRFDDDRFTSFWL